MSERYELHHGDCLDILRTLPDNSIAAVVTDPPYGLAFMGKKWDYDVPSEDIWRECLRVLKPGGHLLAFAGTRTQHRMALRIEDAGFEIRDMIAWVYGSGFPKSLDVSKAIDKAAGAEREVVGSKLGQPGYSLTDGKGGLYGGGFGANGTGEGECRITAPATDAARQWHGWGTALKPALEPITVARKPLIGTVAENVLTWGTGGVNIDGCRIGTEARVNQPGSTNPRVAMGGGWRADAQPTTASGRWPANLIHDGSEEVMGLFPESKSGIAVRRNSGGCTFGSDTPKPQMDDIGYGDSGSAARFFYCAKASKRDRDEGCEGLEERVAGVGNVEESSGRDSTKPGNQYGDGSRRRVEAGLSPTIPRHNHHPTVKPTDLMRYLCRLVTPPGGVVLDPFTGSGSTGKAAILEGFHFVGIEREAEYIDIARARIQHAVDSLPNTLFDNTGE